MLNVLFETAAGMWGLLKARHPLESSHLQISPEDYFSDLLQVLKTHSMQGGLPLTGWRNCFSSVKPKSARLGTYRHDAVHEVCSITVAKRSLS